MQALSENPVPGYANQRMSSADSKSQQTLEPIQRTAALA